MSMGARLKEVRKSLGLTQAQLAEKLGFEWHKIKAMEIGQQKINPDLAEEIEKIFSISGWWLLTGKGSKGTKAQPIQSLESEAQEEGDMVAIPYYKDASAAAGCGVINHHSEAEILKMSKTFLTTMYGVVTFTGLEALNVIGESMAPQLSDGDIIIVLKNAPLIQGGVYVIVWHGEAMVKRVQRNPKTGAVRLISDNQLCESYTVEDDVLCQILHIKTMLHTLTCSIKIIHGSGYVGFTSIQSKNIYLFHWRAKKRSGLPLVELKIYTNFEID